MRRPEPFPNQSTGANAGYYRAGTYITIPPEQMKNQWLIKSKITYLAVFSDAGKAFPTVVEYLSLREKEELTSSSPEDPSDWGYLGGVLRCWAFTAPDRAANLFQRCISNWAPLWDQDKWFTFTTGAWIFLFP